MESKNKHGNIDINTYSEENKEKVKSKQTHQETIDAFLISKDKKKGFLREIIGASVFLVLASILIRIFIIESYTIPSESMVSTLKIGDRLIATKFTYGVRIPIVNISFSGIIKPKRGDIIIFEHPQYESPGLNWELLNLLTLGIFRIDNNKFNVRILVKRCMATAGDTIIIDSNKDIYINGEKLDKVLVEENEDNLRIFKETNHQKTYIIQEKEADSFTSHTSSPTFYIPKRGDKLVIRKVESEYERKYVYEINDLIIEDDLLERCGYRDIFSKEMKANLLSLTENHYEHTIKYDYYFGMGDNRDNSRDSRSWGLIREDLIFGSPLFIFFPISRAGFVK